MVFPQGATLITNESRRRIHARIEVDERGSRRFFGHIDGRRNRFKIGTSKSRYWLKGSPPFDRGIS
jgi:hypothetical protein